ncbi:hypothetical protein Tco_0755972 [Tanacetum coccineum]
MTLKNTPYPHQRYAVYNTLVNEEESTGFTSIRRFNALALSDRHSTYHETPSDRVKIDNPNITMEEYIRLEEEKAHRRGKVYNWETTTYGKIWDNEDVHDLESIETEFPAIVFNDTLTSEATLAYEPTVSSLNNEIDFRISFYEFDDEDCTPGVSYFNDLDYFNDFENEFPTIVYNDAQTSKSDLLIEPILSPQHIDEFNLNDETSLSEYDEEEQNVLYFNDLFPFHVIHPNDLKSDKDNDDDKIDIEQSSGGINTTYPGVWIRCIDFLYSFRTLRNIDEYWWRIYKSGDLEVLES